MNKGLRRLICAALLSALATSSGAADVERTDLGDRVPTKEELIGLLAVKPALPTRSGEPAPPPKPRAISAGIGFEYNSAALTEQGKTFLNNLGSALSDEAFMNAHILLEGHTDARGTEDYNLDLSRRRAEAVKKFLTDVWGMPNANVSTVGKGKSDLLDKDNPESAANRAVVIINTGSR
jgi:outer membrane protein OmpA-like peptidoglycan-associated protein